MLKTIHKNLRQIGLIAAAIAVTASGSVLLAPTPASAGSVCDRPLLRQSSVKKECVKYLQRMLNIMRPVPLNAPLKVDGYFGSQTTSAVRYFQRVEHIAVDGVVGPQTWRRLCQDSGQPLYHRVHNTDWSAYLSYKRAAC